MKTITKTITARSYQETIESITLSSRAKDKARQWMIESATDEGWNEFTLDEWKTALSQIGFENAEIAFNGFWSQGDGASFTADCDASKLIEFLKSTAAPTEYVGMDGNYIPYVLHQLGWKSSQSENFSALKDYVGSAKVMRSSSRYFHENTCSFEIELFVDGFESNEANAMGELCDKFESACESLRKELSKAIYKALERDYNYLTEDEHLIELAEANDYLFDENGNPVGE